MFLSVKSRADWMYKKSIFYTGIIYPANIHDEGKAYSGIFYKDNILNMNYSFCKCSIFYIEGAFYKGKINSGNIKIGFMCWASKFYIVCIV